MEYILGSLFVILAFIVLYKISRKTTTDPDTQEVLEAEKAQAVLDDYLNADMNNLELGTRYERYIGHLYESQGHDVIYNGAINGYADMGRDLIVGIDNEIHLIQTKYWAKHKKIKESHIFQLYGSMMHYKLTSSKKNQKVKAVFYTTAQYNNSVKEIAKVLEVELKTQDLNRTYPMIKCNINSSGEKIYHLPFDPYYDKVKIKPKHGECFVHTTQEAVAKGFRRARAYPVAA